MSVRNDYIAYPEFQTAEACARRVRLDDWLLEFLNYCDEKLQDARRPDLIQRRMVLSQRTAELAMKEGE